LRIYAARVEFATIYRARKGYQKAGRELGSCCAVAIRYLIGFAPIGADCARINRSLPRWRDNCHNLQALSGLQALPEFQNTQYL
jgi:hypothetical protein